MSFFAELFDFRVKPVWEFTLKDNDILIVYFRGSWVFI